MEISIPTESFHCFQSTASFDFVCEETKKEPIGVDYAVVEYKPASECSGCCEPIGDPLILSVGGRRWHGTCLRCSLCQSSLESSKSCFLRDDVIYCRSCYSTQFGTKCAGCSRPISSTDWVRRARHNVYHIACFGCHQCKRQLSTGEEFALQENRLLCKQHYLELIDGDSGQSKQKTKRVRTTFADEQLSVLQAHFQIDSNPDGADLERIAQLTGLSKRVTQVWFQNSRARQKKYAGARGKAAPGTSAASLEATRGGGISGDSVPSSEEALSPRSTTSSDDLFPTSVTTSVDDSMIHHHHHHHGLHKADIMHMGLQAIDYD